jgi:putative MATE family efflux protein
MAPVDMTTGSPWRKIAVFAFPMFLGNIAQQLYNTVDSIVVGRYVGDLALAAVGSAGPVMFLLIVLFVGISNGASIMVAQYQGARDKERLALTIGNCIVSTGVCAIFVAVLAYFTVRPFLVLLNTPDTIIDWCQSYLLIILCINFGQAYFSILSEVLRGLGDSASPLIFLSISTILNIILDIYFVASLGLGVTGVAIATVISQSVSALLCLIKIMRQREFFRLKPVHFKPNGIYVKKIASLGLPTGITQAVFSLSMIVVQSLTNSFGELFIAANVIVMRVDGFVVLPNLSFGTAMTTYSGQNTGAKLYDRVEKGARQGTFLVLGITTIFTALVLLFGHQLMGIFTSTNELISLSIRCMMIISPGYIAMAVSQSLLGIMRGAGDTITPLWVAIITTVILRVPLAYFLSFITRSAEYPIGRSESVFISLGVAWVMGGLLAIIFYKRGKWKEKSVI